MNARFTLVGFENELNSFDTTKSLKDAWVLEDCEDFSAETLLSTIILKGGQMEPLYSDPTFYYMMNQQWWNKWKPTFQKWCEALHAEYNPIWNKDYYEDIHEDTYDVGTNNTVTQNSTVEDDDTTYSKHGNSKEVIDDDATYEKSGDNSSNTEVTVSAFDSSSPNTYLPHDNTSVSGDFSEEGESTDDKTTTATWGESGSGTDDKTTTFNGDIDNDSTMDRDFDRTSHLYGNIGVTSSQKLVNEELELRYWNFYDHVSDIFLDEMAIRVY